MRACARPHLGVEYPMLDRTRHPHRLHPPHVRGSERRPKLSILAGDVLAVTSVTGHAVDVDAWAEDDVGAFAAEFGADGAGVPVRAFMVRHTDG